MKNPIPFSYEDIEIRAVEIDGEPWLVAKDICDYFGVSNRNRLLQQVDSLDKGGTRLDTPGGTQEFTVINESGFYTVIFALNPNNARGISEEEKKNRYERVHKFRRWVTHEVLPSIRKTGQYSAITFDKQIPKTLPEALHAYAREIEAREALEAYAREIEPKADAYDHFLSGDGTYSVGAAAKILGLSQNKLFAELRNAGILIAKGHMRNTPYQQYMHHFQVKAYDYTRTDGTVGTSYTTTVQPSGLAFIERKLGMIPTPEVI